ncbi:MAG: HAMP domain-containing sensor histidine kinase [Pseudomonadota bacterium]
MHRHLYVRIIALIVGSLLAFSVLAYLLWSILGFDRYEEEFQYRTAAMIEALAPEATTTPENNKAALKSLANILDAEITFYDADQQLLGASGIPAELDLSPTDAGVWVSNLGQTKWATLLKDGRFIVLVLDRPPVPDLAISFAVFLFLLSALVSALMYPLVRSVTARLERLQKSVEEIGDGALGARVNLEGKDEVASVARSFNATAERIERLVQSQKLLLAHASHELRTPLARIRMGIEFLQNKDDPARREALQRDIEELNALIEELLTLSRLDAPSSDNDLEDVDLLALAAIECANYKGCTLSGERLPTVRANGRLLQHLIRNLLDNAKHHGATPITVDLASSGNSVSLSVTDAGPGIPDELKEHVFEPFRRGPDRQNVPGYGLGLTLVKRIVASLKGEIRIQNSPQSRVSIELPCSTQ